MTDITVYFSDGAPPRKFEHGRGRPGGSYTNKIDYKGGFAIITDLYGKQEIFPAHRINRIELEPELR